MSAAGYTQAAGAGMQMGGQVMSGFGEYQGLKSMAAEKERQIGEEEAARAEQQKYMEAELQRRQLGLASDSSSPFLAAGQGALRGAGAMSQQLGLNSADRAKVQGAMLPQQVLAAQQMGQNQQAQQNDRGMGNMGANIMHSQRDQSDRAALYDIMNLRAAEKGQRLREWGEATQQSGQAVSGIGAGMAQKNNVAPANATYENTGMSIYPMANQPAAKPAAPYAATALPKGSPYAAAPISYSYNHK